MRYRLSLLFVGPLRASASVAIGLASMLRFGAGLGPDS
jgi:hypothetical protein